MRKIDLHPSFGPTDYLITNIDEFDHDTYDYFGYCQTGGTNKWYIVRINRGGMTWEYVSGTGGYAAAWADRENKTYGLP